MQTTVKDDQIRRLKSLPLAFRLAHQRKIRKSTADAGRRCSSSRAQVRCNAQFAQWFLAHDISSNISTSNSDERYGVPKMMNSCLSWIWRVVLWLFGAPSWLKVNSLTK